MNPVLKYGKIPVGIYKINKVDNRRYGNIVLIYLHTFPDGYNVICPLKSKYDRYRHQRISYSSYRTYMDREWLVSVPYDEALVYLQRYCNHFMCIEMRKKAMSYFSLRESMSRSLVHFSLQQEGGDECPCEEIFTMREQAPNTK